MVGTQAEDGKGARDVRRQDGVVFARERASVCHTPPYARMRARTHTRMHCVCLYVYMFASAYVCTSANGQADHYTGWG